MRELKFFRCRHCGNIIAMINDSGVPVICCGEKMELLSANTVDASREKHVPALTVDGDSVKVAVGSAAHPMIPEHFIQWICLQSENGEQLKYLKAGDAPEAEFMLCKDKPVAVYAYCNLHGLWKTEL